MSRRISEVFYICIRVRKFKSKLRRFFKTVFLFGSIRVEDIRIHKHSNKNKIPFVAFRLKDVVGKEAAFVGLWFRNGCGWILGGYNNM